MSFSQKAYDQIKSDYSKKVYVQNAMLEEFNKLDEIGKGRLLFALIGLSKDTSPDNLLGIFIDELDFIR